MKLYIAEKPSLARAIAAVLPKPQQNQDGYIQLANGDCVSWCIGHLLENAEPQDYQAQFKQWRASDLPIVPESWQLKAKSNTKKQLGILAKLIKKADTLVHAGDPDRVTGIPPIIDTHNYILKSNSYIKINYNFVDSNKLSFLLTKLAYLLPFNFSSIDNFPSWAPFTKIANEDHK